MDYNTSDYFSYKKNKLQTKVKKDDKSFSRFNFLFQLFIGTFVCIFIGIVILIMQYSSKMDIEYSQGDVYTANNPPPVQYNYNTPADEARGKIDKRLSLIQQEDNAPSEAKIITKKENASQQVIDPAHIENSKKIEKIEKIKAQNVESENNSTNKIKEAIQEVKKHAKVTTEETTDTQKNVIITSKVLIGRYMSFEEAQSMQSEIKLNEPGSNPFVRKTGDVFSVQMGSYQDFSSAKSQAQALKAKGFDVWIYQQ